MQKITAIRHVTFEHLGTLDPLWRNNGWQIQYLDAGLTDISALDPIAPDLLVVLGGPIGAYEENLYPFLLDELRILERRLAAELPVLGICLGAQLMARALGSKVYPGRAKEIGWFPLQLTAAGQKSCLAELASCNYQVLHWHGDTFDLPAGCQHLAATDVTINQAWSFGNTALGLQFHLEIAAAEIEQWLIGHAHEIATTPGVSHQKLRQDTANYGAALATSAANCMSSWLQQFA